MLHMNTYLKTDIAVEMLDAAIVEYIDHQRYFAAYNLAGVADELLGKVVRLEGKTDALTNSVELNKVVMGAIGMSPRPDKELKKLINTQKNSIKHMDSEQDREVQANMPDDARRMIGRALRNYHALRLGSRDTIQRFDESRRKELERHQAAIREELVRETGGDHNAT